MNEPLDELAGYLRENKRWLASTDDDRAQQYACWLTALEHVRADARRYRILRDEQWDFNGATIWDTDSSELDAAIDALARKEGE